MVLEHNGRTSRVQQCVGVGGPETRSRMELRSSTRSTESSPPQVISALSVSLLSRLHSAPKNIYPPGIYCSVVFLCVAYVDSSLHSMDVDLHRRWGCGFSQRKMGPQSGLLPIKEGGSQSWNPPILREPQSHPDVGVVLLGWCKNETDTSDQTCAMGMLTNVKELVEPAYGHSR